MRNLWPILVLPALFVASLWLWGDVRGRRGRLGRPADNWPAAVQAAIEAGHGDSNSEVAVEAERLRIERGLPRGYIVPLAERGKAGR